MTRLKLDWLARPGRDWSQTFVIMIAITIVYAIVTTMLRPAVVVNYDDEVGMTTETETASPIYDMTTFVYGVFMLVVLTITRKVVRERYQIPETRCVGCEDVCCALWCGCCTVSQLARQTADYDVEDAQFFTPDGLASRQTTPVIIV
jgi:Cys-rich protein (TIGR01571 family)